MVDGVDWSRVRRPPATPITISRDRTHVTADGSKTRQKFVPGATTGRDHDWWAATRGVGVHKKNNPRVYLGVGYMGG